MFGVHSLTIALCAPERFAQAFEDGVFGFVHFQTLAQGLVRGTDAGRLIDAELIGNGHTFQPFMHMRRDNGFTAKIATGATCHIINQAALIMPGSNFG